MKKTLMLTTAIILWPMLVFAAGKQPVKQPVTPPPGTIIGTTMFGPHSPPPPPPPKVVPPPKPTPYVQIYPLNASKQINQENRALVKSEKAREPLPPSGMTQGQSLTWYEHYYAYIKETTPPSNNPAWSPSRIAPPKERDHNMPTQPTYCNHC